MKTNSQTLVSEIAQDINTFYKIKGIALDHGDHRLAQLATKAIAQGTAKIFRISQASRAGHSFLELVSGIAIVSILLASSLASYENTMSHAHTATIVNQQEQAEYINAINEVNKLTNQQ